jgi:ABC-type branched-subunit amino acid transport system substrate-binding protein
MNSPMQRPEGAKIRLRQLLRLLSGLGDFVRLREIAFVLRVFGSLMLAIPLCASALAQSNSQPLKPYAAINPANVMYVGPDRASSRDLKGPEIRIGLLAPLQGPRKTEGEALILAARLALQDQSDPGPGRRGLSLAVGDESGPWGRASSEVARLVFDEQAAAIVTSAEGSSAHLAEQIGNRIGVPVVTLANDSTTTQINLPWIFRLAPDDRLQAEAFARAIYSVRRYREVVLVVECDHDGRLGATEFEKASSRWGDAAPNRVELGSASLDLPRALAGIQAYCPEAVVVWAGPSVANQLLPALQGGDRSLAIFLCQKAAIGVSESRSGGSAAFQAADVGIFPPKQKEAVWTVCHRVASAAARARFVSRFKALTGRPPSLEAEASYDAVNLIALALHHVGPNRARLRDQLARVSAWTGVSGEVSFDGAGNNLAPIEIVPRP